MEKITIACLEQDRQSAVSQLQKLGTVHVVPMAEPASDAMDALRLQKERLSKVINAFGNILAENKAKPGASPLVSPEKTVDEVLGLLEDNKLSSEELSKVRRNISALRPWGQFSDKIIADLAKRGINVLLCSAAASNMPTMPENAVLKVISEERGTAFFAVIFKGELDRDSLPTVTLPENTDLSFWTDKEKQLEKHLDENRNALLNLAISCSDALNDFAGIMDERLAFATARDGMLSSGRLAFLKGYVPCEQIDILRATAVRNGWAIRYESVPDDDADAPTDLKIPKAFSMARQIFDFVGILPGYHEIDVSVSMLVFLSLFCGILVGDAGYGTIMTLLVLWFRRKVTDEKKRSGMNLLLIMSLSVLIYGALTCNWFAIPTEKFPSWLNICPWMCNNDKHIQLLSLFIGAFHMCLARVWRSILAARQIKLSEDNTWTFLKKIREVIGHLSWGLFIWANFGLTKQLIVVGGDVKDLPAPYAWLYGIGLVMILIFNIDWTDMGTIIYMPFSFINDFVDVLSYIRLYAVGLSGFYIANSFNGMATSLHSINMPWLSIPGAILILLAGHLLNVALACMGVLVHGVRLNTLEFSGHMDLSWSGKPYKPLKSTEPQNESSIN